MKCVCVCVHVCVCACVCPLCVCTCIYYVHVHVCIYVHIIIGQNGFTKSFTKLSCKDSIFIKLVSTLSGTSVCILMRAFPLLNLHFNSLDMANLWLERNGLKLSSSKTKSMLIHSNRKSSSDLKLMIDGTEIEQVCCFKFLRVLVNDTSTWSDHVNFICTKVTRSLSLLHRRSWFLSQSLLLLFLKSYILPSFEYCNVVWSGCTKNEALRLKTPLNFACRTVLHERRDFSASTARKQLGLSTLSFRRKLHLAQTMFKCLLSQSPQYLSQLFSAPSSHYNTRSSSSSQLNLPCTKSSLGQKAFSFTGASL